MSTARIVLDDAEEGCPDTVPQNEKKQLYRYVTVFSCQQLIRELYTIDQSV